MTDHKTCFSMLIKQINSAPMVSTEKADFPLLNDRLGVSARWGKVISRKSGPNLGVKSSQKCASGDAILQCGFEFYTHPWLGSGFRAGW